MYTIKNVACPAISGEPVVVGVTMYVLSISSLSEVQMVPLYTKHVIYYYFYYFFYRLFLLSMKSEQWSRFFLIFAKFPKTFLFAAVVDHLLLQKLNEKITIQFTSPFFIQFNTIKLIQNILLAKLVRCSFLRSS